MRIGLTGGVCTGKSTALRVFKELGFDTIDLDSHIREALQGNDNLKIGAADRIQKSFDAHADGKPDFMDRVTRMISAGGETMGELEDLILPELESMWPRDARIVTFVEIPMLFEKNLERHFDFVICVYSNYAMQLARAAMLRNWPKSRVDACINLQMPLSEKMEYSNYVIGNNGTPLQFYRQIRYFIQSVDILGKLRRIL
ncbi:MAG: dephospho-CoA kinase [Puniceicoccales bacterium]|jgi:dephospho-CoA kinase|nr:dephospho-CoA kinase [Puniceicoccales bacterium]